MTKDEAIDKVFAELNAMTPEEFRAKLDKHKDGEFARALKEVSEFVARQTWLYEGGVL